MRAEELGSGPGLLISGGKIPGLPRFRGRCWTEQVTELKGLRTGCSGGMGRSGVHTAPKRMSLGRQLCGDWHGGGEGEAARRGGADTEKDANSLMRRGEVRDLGLGTVTGCGRGGGGTGRGRGVRPSQVPHVSSLFLLLKDFII